MKPKGLWMEFMIRQSLDRRDCVTWGDVGSFFFVLNIRLDDVKYMINII